MHLNILGSGGSIYFPRPCCECKKCEEVRKKCAPLSRTGPALYVYDEAILFDTPEAIYYQLEREKIKKMKHVFYTHWHPDHTQGSQIFEHINFTHAWEKKKEPIDVYVPEEAYPDFEKFVPPTLIYYDKQGWINLHIIKDRKKIVIGKVSVTPINIFRTDRVRFAFLIEQKKKRVMYAPCSIFQVKLDKYWENLDLLVMEFGWFKDSKGKQEKREEFPGSADQDHISLEENIEIINKLKPKRTILTHLEGSRHVSLEDAIREISLYKKPNVEPAVDGMQIEL